MPARRWVVRSRGRIAHTLAVAAAVVMTVAVTAATSSGRPPAATLVGFGGSGVTHASPRPAFTIDGDVDGLYPGASSQLQLSVTNNEPFAIVVVSIMTSVSDATSTCPASNLAVGSFIGHLSLRAGEQAVTTVAAVLRHGAPDACQGATFPLQYTGSARRP